MAGKKQITRVISLDEWRRKKAIVDAVPSRPEHGSAEPAGDGYARVLPESELHTFKPLSEMKDGIPNLSAQTAQSLVMQAWETPTQKKRIALAEKAVSLDPDCADAFNLLGGDKTLPLDDRIGLFEHALMAAQRNMGKGFKKKYDGQFWEQEETRPYMRAMDGLAGALWENGERTDAVNIYRYMLQLNRRDHQGIRYLLAVYLLEMEMYDAYLELLSSYPDDPGAEWAYANSLYLFISTGNSREAVKKLKEAIDRNDYVPSLLTGKEKIPRTLPETMQLGTKSEAVWCAFLLHGLWAKVPHAIEWLKENLSA